MTILACLFSGYCKLLLLPRFNYVCLRSFVCACFGRQQRASISSSSSSLWPFVFGSTATIRARHQCRWPSCGWGTSLLSFLLSLCIDVYWTFFFLFFSDVWLSCMHYNRMGLPTMQSFHFYQPFK
ncbi:hypothetical protein PVAP13_1KG399600 [Panicum virgatum]|uniref:Uncharacterized protein n=1 Tax=Panicum virgatum TaxID=38727 RepID=A0A8T0XP77_PANVG|nr:hypothetical protein PVAP13_1KG399600 [Panicum virgatum]